MEFFFFRKNKVQIQLSTGKNVTFKDRNNLSKKGGEKIYHGNKNHKKYGLPTPISEKTDFNKCYQR